jgi:hypothetical protein
MSVDSVLSGNGTTTVAALKLLCKFIHCRIDLNKVLYSVLEVAVAFRGCSNDSQLLLN